MRKVTLTIFSFLALSYSTYSQTSELGKPMSWNGKMTKQASIPIETMPTFDVAEMLAADAINEANKVGPWRFGYEHSTKINMMNKGVWESTPKGDRIWRIHLNSPGALSMNIQFHDFFIPKGGNLQVYTPDHIWIDGAYTNENNNENNMLGTNLVPGESMIVEYFEPSDQIGNGRLMIGMVVHGYKALQEFTTQKVNESGACNLDVICPAGDPWREEIRSVARIVVGGGLCTGTLMNNTAQDGTPYFLTADHCGPGSMGSAVFRFNYDSPTCGSQSSSNSTTPSTNHTVNGSSLKANNSTSDFGLVRLNSVPPVNYGVYYAGWNRSGDVSATAVGIHHPAGDVKKISFDDDPVTITSYSGTATPGNGSHIRIETWERNTTTEGGSSGSAIWDENHHVVGQLHGGGAACGNTQSDWYGRFSVSWDGANSAVRLRDWLDPSNTTTTLDGWDPNAPTVANDAGIQTVTDPGGTICGSTITPVVVLKNYGTSTLTSVTISYDLDGGSAQTYNWTGSLVTGATASISLNTMAVTDGSHTFNVSTSMPNSSADLNTSNDAKASAILVAADPVDITLTLVTDDYGSETSWQVVDASSNVWYSGSGYSDVNGGETITVNMCVAEDCYDFVISDAFGDGICCAYGNGSYSVTEDATSGVLVSGATFTTSETKNFCLSPQVLTANFSSTPMTVCVGGSLNFSDMSAGSPTTWTWTLNGGTPNSSNAENPTGILYNTIGTYDVSLIVGDGVSTDSKTVSALVNVIAEASASFNPSTTLVHLDEGGVVNFTNTSTGGSSYSWSFGDGSTSNAQNPSHTYSTPGSYVVTLTTTNAGCSDVATVTIVVDLTNGINENSTNLQVTFRPNPTSGFVTINLGNVTSGVISISNVLGQEIAVIPFSQSEVIFDAKTLGASGTYFVHISGSNGETLAVKRLIYQ